jgi:PleD family two-component response regulator
VDEAPSVYIHKIDVLLAQARSNLSAVVLGIQELPMLRQQYGKEAADTIMSIMGNIISGAVRSKDTLEMVRETFWKSKATR